jgi:hypothetical protein
MSQPQYQIRHLGPTSMYDGRSPPAFHRPFVPQQHEYELPLQEPRPVLDFNGPRRLSPPDVPQYGSATVQRYTHTGLSPTPSPYASAPTFEAPPSLDWRTSSKNSRYTSKFSQHSGTRRQKWITRSRELMNRYIVEWWLVEILSWGFSAICMLAIIAALLYYNGKELPQLPLGITLNGVLTALSGLAKAALLLPTVEGLGQHKWSQ